MDFTNGFYVPVLVNSTPRYLCCFTTSRGAPLIVRGVSDLRVPSSKDYRLGFCQRLRRTPRLANLRSTPSNLANGVRNPECKSLGGVELNCSRSDSRSGSVYTLVHLLHHPHPQNRADSAQQCALISRDDFASANGVSWKVRESTVVEFRLAFTNN
jgi:hypothetical protein